MNRFFFLYFLYREHFLYHCRFHVENQSHIFHKFISSTLKDSNRCKITFSRARETKSRNHITPMLRSRDIVQLIGLSREREQNVELASRRLRGREPTGNTIRCDATGSSIIARTRAVSSSRKDSSLFFFSLPSRSRSSSSSSTRACSDRGAYRAACPAFRSFITRREQWRATTMRGKAMGITISAEREVNRGEPDLEAPSFRHRRSIRVFPIYILVESGKRLYYVRDWLSRFLCVIMSDSAKHLHDHLRDNNRR